MSFRLLKLMVFIGALTACVSNQPALGSKDTESAAAYNLQLGIDYFRQGNLSQAKEKLDRSLMQNPKSAQAHAAAGLLYERLNDMDKADQHYSRAVDLDSGNGEVVNTYGVFLCRRGNYTKGEQLAVQAASNQLYKTPEAAWFNAGMCALEAGKATVAEQHFRRALTANEKFSPALLQLSDLKFKSDAALQARAFLERFHLSAQATAESLWLGVRIEQALANPAVASEYARRLKSEFPNSAQTKALLQAESKQ